MDQPEDEENHREVNESNLNHFSPKKVKNVIGVIEMVMSEGVRQRSDRASVAQNRLFNRIFESDSVSDPPPDVEYSFEARPRLLLPQ
jgi:hypothetical protein